MPQQPQQAEQKQDMDGSTTMAIIPSKYICPLTQSIMKHPVVTKQGVHYEQSAILEWLGSNNHSHCVVHTDVKLALSDLSYDLDLEKEIRAFLNEQDPVEKEEEDKQAPFTIKKRASVDHNTTATTTSLADSSKAGLYAVNASRRRGSQGSVAARPETSDWGSPLDLTDMLDGILYTVKGQ